MVLIAVTCPYCQRDQIAKRGKTETGKQRYRCQNLDCPHQSFLLNPAYKGHLPEIKAQIIDMARNGSGIRRCEKPFWPITRTVLMHGRDTIFSKDVDPSVWPMGLYVMRAPVGTPVAHVGSWQVSVPT